MGRRRAHFTSVISHLFSTVSPSLAQHFSELEHTIVHKETTKTEVIEFITDFVRPGGLVQPATPIFIEAVEDAAKVTPKPWRVPLWAPWLRLLISPWAWMFRRHVLTRTNGAGFEGVERTRFPRFLNPRGDSTADSDAKINNFTMRTDDALAKIAKSNKPIVLGPWLSEVGFELLYWIPLVRWAIEYYGLDPHRFIVVSRGGVQDWYTDISHRYVELFDYFSPTEFVAFNAARQKASGMQKQKGVADVELNLVDRIKMDLGFDTCELLHPRLMYSGVLRYHWSQRSSMDHLLLHARFQRMKIPDPTDLEAQLPTNYYAVRFYSRDSFHRQ